MRSARAERLLATEERRVGPILSIHEVSEELPPGWGLEEVEFEGVRHHVERPGGGHAPRHAAHALGELRDRGLGVGGEDGHRVRRRDEETAAQDHVAVAVTVGGGPEVGGPVGGLGRVAGGVESHELHQLFGVRKVGVRVAATEVGQGGRVDAALRRGAQQAAQHRLGPGPPRAVHAVEDEFEVGPGDECFEGDEVEALAQGGHVVLHRVDHLHLAPAHLAHRA
mmetsp:Transcript_3366/g.7795  ORF Transcript_3366/g.7795 Transcript_3366/m.7795 type:complete len:224 (+) Transcript_3366:648-1319(+)